MNSIDWYLMLVSAFTGALMLGLPHLSPRRYFFAVTVGEGYRASPAARQAIVRYSLWVLAATAVAIALPWRGWGTPLPLLAGFVAFFRERSRTLRHRTPAPDIREATLAPDRNGPPRWLFFLGLLPLLFPAATALYIRAHWAEIPEHFPIHWGLNGQPDNFAEKTPGAVYGMLGVGAILTIMLLAIAVATYYGARRGPQRIAVTKILVAVAFVVSAILSAVGLMPLVSIPMWAFLLPGPILVVGVLIWAFRAASDNPGEVTPDECWRLGMFYYNPQDATLFVQKRIGYGYTFNFANGWSWVILGGLVAVPLALIFLVPK